jgi:GNAT superfamily N-acetyltransferase
MEIEYRHFKPGDENGLAEVFNLSFQSLGGGFLRTPKSFSWRYINRPGGMADEIQLAVDINSGRIVGNVCSTIEHQVYSGQQIKTGAINDVAVLPEYRKYGIARRLMDQAIEFMEKQGCEISVLCADAKGHPRSKLYLPLGWQDYTPLEIWYRLIDYNLFCRYVPGALMTIPPYLLTRPIYWLRSQHILNKCRKYGFDFVDFTYTPNNPESTSLSRRLMILFNTCCPRHFEGHTHYSLDEWIYFREQPLIRDFLPTYSIVTFHGDPIGFVSFCRQFIYVSKL